MSEEEENIIMSAMKLLVSCTLVILAFFFDDIKISPNFSIFNSSVCNFKIITEGRELIPVDNKNGDQIGFFERKKDGSITLTRTTDEVTDVTQCFKDTDSSVIAQIPSAK